MPEPAEIAERVAQLREPLVALASELVRCPSLPDHEHEAQGLVAERLAAAGLEVDTFACRFEQLRDHPAFVDDGHSPTQRTDVVGRWQGADPDRGRSLVLNGHIDVVPAGPIEGWSADPFEPYVRDGHLYGRGSCDMKAGLSAAIIAVEALRGLGLAPLGDVQIQSVVGEETGGVGTLAALVRGYRADAAMILEPTGLQLCPVQAGALTFRLEVDGRAVHGALRHEGVSAIERAVPLLTAIDDLDRARHRERTHPLFPDPAGVAPISIGTLHAGEWHSTVPATLIAEGRMGVFPDESVAAARAALEHAVAAAADADPWLRSHPPRLTWVEGQFAPGATDLDHPFVTTLADAHRESTGEGAVLAGVPYGSDLRLFTEHAGMPAVLYGPGEVRRAHTADEHVAVDEVLTAATVVAATIVAWCGTTPADGA